MNRKEHKPYYKKSVFAFLLISFMGLCACDNGEDRNTDADAQSTQDRMQTDVSQGAGYSTDTSGVGTIGTQPDTISNTEAPREVIPPNPMKSQE